MLRFFKRIIAWWVTRRSSDGPPRTFHGVPWGYSGPPHDPHLSVREPRKHGPGGARGSDVAVVEPEPDRVVEAISGADAQLRDARR